jgi:hypothetical protein
MLRFYWSTVRRLHVILWTATDRYVTGLGIGSAVLTFFSPELAQVSWISVPALSRWWALLPLGVLFLYGMLRANYEAFKKIENRNADLEAKLVSVEKRRTTLDLLGRYHAKGQELARDNPRVEEMPEATAEEISEWGQGVYRLIRAAYGSGRAEIFLSGKDRGYIEVWLQERLAQLVRLMEQTSEMDLRPDFDPEDFDHQD